MVRYISWYINNRNLCKGGSPRIDIKAEVEKFKSRCPGINPVVIFDYMSCIGMLIESEDEILCGGRQTECTRRAKEICQKFKSLGVEMVFFLDGPIKNEKLPIWQRHTNEKYEKHTKIFEAIRNNKSIDFKYTGQILSTYFDNFLRVAREYGKVIIALENECDIEIALYATKVRALAVFATDSDFLIMKGDWSVWSPKNLNIEKFTTTAWNKISLRKSLKLKQEQMPVLATICGNDYMPFDMLEHIPEMLQKGCTQEMIAAFVCRHFPKGVPLSDDDFNTLVDVVYDGGKNKYDLEVIKRQIKKSLEFYTHSVYRAFTVEPTWLREHIDETKSTIVYIILKDIAFTVNQSFIDLSKTDVRPFSELVLPLMRRQMGIILYDQREKNLTRRIYYKPSHTEPFGVHDVEPLYPDKEIPNIIDLLGHGAFGEEISDEERFEVLAWALSSGRKKLKPSILIEMSYSLLLIPSLILNYLVKLNQITVDEADVVLLTIYEAAKAPNDKMKTIQPPKSYQERPFWIAFVYTHLIYYFLNSFIVCGLFKIIKNGCFDGYVFHKMYSKYLSLTYEEKQTHLVTVQKFRLYVK